MSLSELASVPKRSQLGWTRSASGLLALFACATIGSMEIEAKFTVPDRAIFERLLQVEELAGFALSPARLKQLYDQYLDTADARFLRDGFACRLRMDSDGGRLLTLKSLTPAQGPLHAREELELRLSPKAGLAVADWPAGNATALASQLSGGQPLELLFDLRQERYQRLAIPAGSQMPAVELSIDVTRLQALSRHELLGVEAELLPAGDLASLQAMADALQRVWGLRPEPLSKFERGLVAARPELIPLLTPR